MTSSGTRLQYSLFLLRLGVFVVMLMWTLDKFINPGHTTAIFENFYGLAGLGNALIMGLAAVELLILLAFVSGLFKRFSYGAVLLFHAVSTLSSFRQYLDPWDHLLFFAAWPMLAACIALYLLRDDDRLFTIRF
ncbi:MAG: hypothetical protein WD750_11325 [Gammaproteobacteria bacterium]